MDHIGAEQKFRNKVNSNEMLFGVFEFVTENTGSQSEHVKSVSLNMLRRLGLPDKEENEIIELINLIIFN